jgi:type I restriction enzyme S subunit
MTAWPTKQLRFVFSIASGATPASGKPEFWEGDINWATPEDISGVGMYLEETRRKITEAGFESCSAKMAGSGSIVLTKRAPIGQLAITRVELCCNQGCFILEPAADADSEFFFYWLSAQSGWLQALGRGSTFMELSTDEVKSVQAPSIPLARQKAISNFLNHETADIDILISAKQRLLDHLVEKRRAVVTEAVMRGLNPSVPMRSSGIDWLGDVPSHWEVERSRWLFRERDERSQTGEEEMLTVSHLTGVTPRSEKDVNMFEAESTAGYKLCFAGDLAINTLWAWMGAMGTARVDGIVSPAYHVYTPGDRLLPDYVDALVRIPAFAQEVTRYSKGVWSSRLRLYPEGFFETCWPVPPLDEQSEIVAHIAAETGKIDRLHSVAENSIILLKERRAALIAAAVTGQIDVLEAA